MSVGLFLFLLLVAAGSWSQSSGSSGPFVSTGAAAGYVDDVECATCHRQLARGYRRVGMARSFDRPGGNGWVENFDLPEYFHPPSQRYYRMSRNGNDLLFERYQKDSAGQSIHYYRRQVDWVLGSGSVSRSYLYQTPGGEIYQLPIAWYSQKAPESEDQSTDRKTGAWGMSPGYDRADHSGLTRRVRRECLFCHNAYPEVPLGSDRHHRPQDFPQELPHGIGCQRCHGPGAAHIGAVSSGAGADEVIAEIASPRAWTPDQRRDLCYQCHYQPSVALFGIRRFDRGDYSYRPREPLDEYTVQVDVVESDVPSAERFEINHHGYRMEQSRCFVESRGQLECLTCHDPHQKPAREHFRSQVRGECLDCHRTRPGSNPGVAAEAAVETTQRLGDHFAQPDCIACHMPRRRSQDVVHAVMTDHRIQLPSAVLADIEPLEERETVVESVSVLRPPLSLELDWAYRVVGAFRAGHLELDSASSQRLESIAQSHPEVLLDVARGELRRQNWPRVERVLKQVLEQNENDPLALEWLALAGYRQGRVEGAIELLKTAALSHPNRAELFFNLGLILASQEDFSSAIDPLRKAVELNPTMVVAWRYLGNCLEALGRYPEAVDAYTEALAVDPRSTDAYREIVRALTRLDQGEEAERYLEHGRRVAAEPEKVTRPNL